MSSRLCAVLLAACLGLTLGGCGYAFQGAAGKAPENIRRVAIPTVKNNSTYTSLTSDLTDELIRQFILSKALKVTVADVADALLLVTVRSVEVESVARARTSSGSASRRITVVAAAELKRTSDDRVIWKSGRVQSRKTYTVDSDQSVIETNVSNTLEEVAEDLAEKIHDGIFEDF